MDESVTDEVRRQSILKSRTRFPLQEVQSFFGDEDTVTTTLTRNRRVSFGRKVIKEFLIGSAVSTQAVHEYEQSSESVSETSDCSGPLDLALNKSCRDLEAEMEISGEVITPPLSFSDTKVQNPEQRQRQFTENCINIAKSVFQDTETELTAIIIGAKPTSCDDDKKNSSCMSFTTLEVSNDFGHKGHHDFMARHSEMLSHADGTDKGRYDFLDHSLGNITLSGPSRQLPRSPRAPIAHLAAWEQENDENIPPAHNSFRNARQSASRANISETTMEFTCARMEGKSMNLSRANSIWENDSVKENASFLDTTNDEFMDDLLEDEEKSSDDTDSSPLHNIQRELANLSNVNQSFREKVQTLPGMLNASSARVLDVSNDSELSFLQTPENGVDVEKTEAKVDWPTPSTGEISVLDETDDGVEETGQDMEFTRANQLTADETLTCSGGEKTKIAEMTMEMEKTSQPAKGPDVAQVWDPDQETENVFSEQTMEFTHCNRLRQELAEETAAEKTCESLPVQAPDNLEASDQVETMPTMEFTHCNRFRQDSVENNPVVGQPNEIFELTMDIEKTGDELPGSTTTVEEPENQDLTDKLENEPTMEFTHCNPFRQDSVENNPVVGQPNESFELTMDIEKTGDDLPANTTTVEEPENLEATDKLENEPTMEFTHCNRFRQDLVENNPVVEQPNEIFELTMDIAKTGDDLPASTKAVQEPENLEATDKLENEPTMEFTHCNRFRQDLVENNPVVEQPNEIFELTMGIEKTGDDLPTSTTTVEEPENLEATDKLENEPTMEFSHCNRFRQDSVENNPGVEQPNENFELTMDIEKTGDDLPASTKAVQEPENLEATDKLETEPTMEFTHCNRFRQDSVENNPGVEQPNEICELTIDIEKTGDNLPISTTSVEEPENLENLPDESVETTAVVENSETVENVEETCNSLNTAESEKSSEATENSEMQHQDFVGSNPTEEEKSATIAMEMTLHEDPTADDFVEPAAVQQTETPKLELPNEPIHSNFDENTAEEATNSTEALGIEIRIENPSPIEENNLTTESTNVSISPEVETELKEPENNLPETEMDVTSSVQPVDSETENLDTDDTLPADISLDLQPVPPIFEITLINATMDAPQETPVTGLAALSARPSLKQQLLSAAPDSTITQSELIEETLRSMEITEGSIGGVMPKPMKTMSEEQHMQAIHESTRVITEDTFQIQTENTYTLHKVEEATYTVPGLNMCSASEKRTHSDSPCPGERLKKNRRQRDSFGKRMHTESPLPDQSVLKRSRESNTPRASRTLCLGEDESLLLRDGASANLDVSVTLNDISLSQSERSFGLLPMSLPKRSIVPEMEMTEISMPAMQNVSELDTITTHMPVVAMHSLLVDESELEVTSTSNNYHEESGHPEEYRMLDASTTDAREKMVRKVHTALEALSREENCTWKLLRFDETLIELDLPLLATGLILAISLADLKITSLCMTHRVTPYDQWRKITKEINEYGFETLRRYIRKEEKRIRCLDDVPYSLDFFNHFALKLRGVMNDAWMVLHGCAGSQLFGDVLSFRVLSYPSLISCWVDIDLTDLLVLDQIVVRFRHETGRLDERAVGALAYRTVQPMLQNFVRATVAYFEGEEAKLGVHTKNPPLLF